MTEEEKTLLINEIVDYLISHSQSVEGIPIQANLDGVSSFPAIKEVLNEESQVVRVSLDSILPEFRYYNGYVQYRFSSGNWINLFQVSTSLDGYATKDYVDLKVSDVISNAPVTLNTLNKIAAALNYDPSFYQNIYQAINTKWTTNPVKISNWDQAFMDRHIHDNISSLNLITDILVGKWNEAYSWGDHSVAGYEHGLGNPLSNGQILSSNTDGTRSWVDQYIHPQSTVVPGIYTKVTVDLNGHVTYGSGLSQTDIPSISWDQVPFDRPTTLLGYGITDAYTKNYIDKYLQRKYSGVVNISEILLNGNTVTVPASKVNLYSNSKFEGYVSEYEIAEKTFTITGIDVKYIVVSYNNGSPEYIITQERSMINYSNVIPIITLIYDGVKIHSVNWDEQANGLSERLLKRLNRTQRFQRDGGLLINVDGSRTITISQSTIYFGASEVVYPSSSSSTNLIYQYHHSDGVWTYTRSQFLNNLEYDNGTNLVSLSNDNRYTINWVYAGVGDDGDIITVLGSDDYKLDEAINAQPPNILPDIIRFHGILVGKVIYQKGLNTPYQVISISEQSISSGGTVVEHNNLNGLQGGNLEEFYHLSHSEYLNAQDSLSFSSTPGTYRSVTTDSKGRIVSGTNPTTLSEYGISDEDVTNSLLTGYALGQNAEVSSTDSIIGSIGKLQAYINARQGTVTSVGVSVPLGFTVLNSPITTNGVIGIGYTEGYSLPSNSMQSNWSSAYNYSLIGHLPLTGGNLSGNLGITGDLNISGNIYQSGSTYETHAENIYSKNDYIYMRDGSSAGLLDGYYSGLEFVKYDGVNNGRLVIDSYGVARVGDAGDEQPLATREESPLSNGYAYWDGLNKRFNTKFIPFSEIVNKPTTLTGYGITDGQPLDADLSAIANLSDTSGLLRKTSVNTWMLDTNIYLTSITKEQVEAVLTGDIATHTHSQYLTGNQTITVSGDATGSGTTSIALTLANSGVTSGTYNDSATQVRPFTVDSKGRIINIGNAVTITPDWINITSKPTTLSGYGIIDAIKNNGLTESYVPRYTSSGFVNSNIYDNGTDVVIGGATYPHSPNSALNLERINSGTTRLALTNKYESTESSAVITFITRDTIAGVNVLSARLGAVSRVTTGSAPGFSVMGSPNLYLNGAGGFVNVSISNVEKININATNILVKAPIVSTYDITAPTFTGALIGNADSATKLATARAIAGVLFDGTYNIDIPFANLSSKPTTLSGYGITDALNLSGGTLSGNLFIPNNAAIIQNQASTSNYTAAIKWYKGGVSQNVYDPQIGQYNEGGGTGSITILPYSTNIEPWIGTVGLYLTEAVIKFNNNTIYHSGNFTNLNQLTTRNFSDIQNKPITLSGYGITDSIARDDRGSRNIIANNINYSVYGFGYLEDGFPTSGSFISFGGLNNRYVTQIQGSYGGAGMYYRTRNDDNGTWNSWHTILDDVNAYTKTSADNTFLKLAGGTMTGALDFSGTQRNITGVNRFYVTDWTDFQLSAGTRFQILDISTYKYMFKVTAGSTTVEMPDATALKISNNTVWHSGNDGSGSGLDADTLDGVHNGYLTANYFKRQTASLDANNPLSPYMWFYGQPEGNRSNWADGEYGAIFTTLNEALDLNAQFNWFINHNSETPTRSLFFRASNNLGFKNDWKQIAFTTSNVASATKLSTNRDNWLDTGVIDNVVGQLAWRTYGNGHTIFDASNGYTPNGTVCDRENAAVGWSANYPTLMGYNGSHTFGVRVDSSRMADRLRTGRYLFGQYFDGTSDVNGNCVINYNGEDGGVKINNNSDTYSAIRFNDTSGNFATIHAFSGVGYLYNGEKSINIDAAGAVTFGAWNNPILYVQIASKNVGINTTNPAYKLDVNGTLRVTNTATFNNAITLNGSSLAVISPDATGGWARGMFFSTYANPSTTIGGVGALGDGSSFSNVYFGAGTSPWSSYSLRISTSRADIDLPLYGASLIAATRFYAEYDSGQANSMSCSNWFRSSGATGWYNATYGGGIYMEDINYVRIYANKAFKVTSTASDSINTDGGVAASGSITTDSSFINTSYPGNALLLAGGGAMAQSALPFKAGALINAGTIYLTNPSPSASTGLVINSFAISPHESQDGIDYDITFNINSGYSNFDETALKDGKYVISITSLATGPSSYMPAVPNISYINTNNFTVTAYYNGPYIVNILYRV